MTKLIFQYGLLCFFFLSASIGCERADLQKPDTSGSDLQLLLEIRSSCDECPGNDECCCGVWVQDIMMGYAKISLCGTSDGTDSCSGGPVNDCEAFGGGGQSFELVAPLTGRRRFCMNEGDVFYIANTHPTLSMAIYITCQDDITNGQILQITIPPTERWYYSVNNACELAPCE